MVKSGFIFVLLITIIIEATTGCQKELDGSTLVKSPFRISFINKAAGSGLILNTVYLNPFGESITITKFKYYITNISLITTSGLEIQIPDTYYLIDQNTPASTSIDLSIRGSDFQAVKFLIGVDSTHNVSGVQTGALDPANAMFWTWNTGYIMAKLEGTSPVSTAPLQDVTYHIGGFKTGENTVRQITLNFPANLVLKTDATSEIVINADAMKWFNGVHDIKIADIPYVATTGSLAVNMADNYATMFSVAQIINR